MSSIRAKVRNGRIETEGPLDLPDGTELLIFRSSDAGNAENASEDSPEAIAAWLTWYESLKPLIFTAEERDALNQDRKARREWNWPNQTSELKN